MGEETRPTALVTGASSGIGIEFAHELARRGYDLVLTARRLDRLEAVKAELESKWGTKVSNLFGDLGSDAGAKQLYDDVQQLGRPVSFLVNNAGVGKFGHSLNQSLEEIGNMIQLNVVSLTTLTRLFAKDFRRLDRAYILNTGSFSAIQPPSKYAVYAGTKAYVLAYSQALNHDLRQFGTKVTALCPGFFESEFLDQAGHKPSFMMNFLMLDARSVARAGIRGVLRGRAVVIPGVRYKAFSLCMRCLPRTSATWLADLMLWF